VPTSADHHCVSDLFYLAAQKRRSIRRKSVQYSLTAHTIPWYPIKSHLLAPFADAQAGTDTGRFVQPFVSTTINKLDAKRRVSVPASFRQILAKQDMQGFYCLTSDTQPALEGFGSPVLSFYQDRQAAAEPLRSDDYDTAAQEVFGETRLLEFDDQGRVTLPPELLEHAGITERVLFVGLNQKFQIWDPERFEKIRQERIARARAARLSGQGS
jgi:MraZ protein